MGKHLTEKQLRAKLSYEKRKKDRGFREERAYKSRVWYYAQKGIAEADMPVQTRGKYADVNNKRLNPKKEVEKKKLISMPMSKRDLKKIENIRFFGLPEKTHTEVNTTYLTYDTIEACHKFLSGQFVSKRRIDLVFNLLKSLSK